MVYAGYVKGYHRKNGTYVRPHYRSNPDSVKWNNYGSPSYKQKQAYKAVKVLPTYSYDQDRDGILNKDDHDDDNDGIDDDRE